MFKVNGYKQQVMNTKWWQYLTWTFGQGELITGMGF